ncbi:MAG: thermonuclease family protein [Agarilytica sp.]
MQNLPSLSLLSFALILSVFAQAKDYGAAHVKQVVSVYDADTFTVDIYDWPDIVGKKISIRVNGVDAPEIKGECASEKSAAREARDYVRDLLDKSKSITLLNIKRGKYFRLIADVYAENDSLADLLIRKGYARPYDGGKRKGWCG